jgi:hypothetical protein
VLNNVQLKVRNRRRFGPPYLTKLIPALVFVSSTSSAQLLSAQAHSTQARKKTALGSCCCSKHSRRTSRILTVVAEEALQVVAVGGSVAGLG